MGRINRVVILFFLGILVAVSIFFQAIQTERFSNFVSQKISENILKKAGISLSFKKMEVNLFPPVTVLKKISFKMGSTEENTVKLDAESLNLSYGLLDLLSNKFNVRRLKFENGNVYLNKKLKSFYNPNKDNSSFKLTDVFSKIKSNFLGNLKVDLRNLVFERTVINFLDSSLEAEELKLEISSSDIEAKFKLKNFKLNQIIEYPLDYLEVDLQIKEKEWRLNKLNIKSMIDELGLSGSIEELNNRNKLNLSGYFNGSLSFLKSFNFLKTEKINGAVRTKVKVSGEFDKPILDLSFSTGKVLNDYYPIDVSKGILVYRDGSIFINRLSVNDGEVRIKKQKLGKASNLNNSFKNIEIEFEKASIDKVFFSEREQLNVKGNLFGKVKIEKFKGGKLSLFFGNRFNIRKFKFLSSDRKKVILSNSKILIGNTKLDIIDKNNIKIIANLSFKNSNLKILGDIKGENYNFESKNSYIDLEALGPIYNTKIRGRGTFDLFLKSKKNKKKLNIILKKVDGFSVIDLNLGIVSSSLELDLEKFKLKIKDYIGISGLSTYKGNGSIDFNKLGYINLAIKFDKSRTDDGYRIFKEHLPKHYQRLNSIPAFFSSDFNVSGKLSRDKIKVIGKARLFRFKLFGEPIGPIKTNFFYLDNFLNMEKFIVNKGAGAINGSFNYKFGKNEFDSNLTLKKLKISDFNYFKAVFPGLDSDINGSLSLRLGKKEFFSKGGFYLKNSSIRGKVLPDSNLDIKSKNDILITKGSFLGDSLTFESNLAFTKEKQENSFLKGKINILNIKEFFSIVSIHNSNDETLEGKILGAFFAKFNLYNPLEMTSELSFDEFTVVREGKRFSIGDQKSKIKIINGDISKWNLKIGGEEDFFHSIGKGSLSEEFEIENIFKFHSSWVEILSSKIKVESGVVEGRYLLDRRKGSFKTALDLKGKGIDFGIDDIPGRFENLNLYLLGENEDFLIQKFNLKYGKGDVSLGGTIKISLPYPEIDIKYKVSNSNMFLLDNSNVIISGKGSVNGNRLPYVVKGEHLIFGGSILDPLSSLTKKGGRNAQYLIYFPKEKLIEDQEIINIDATFDIINPIMIRNNFSNLNFDGQLNVVGSIEEPLFRGKLNLIPMKSRFVFKGNEFILKNGSVVFKDEFRRTSPELNFLGESVVGEYLINLNITGNANQSKIEFSSTPSLPKEDIFSLLTFGITTNDSQSMEESDRESMTSIGLGSLLVEQFRLNEGVTSSLGLKMSILPELSQDVDSNLLQSQVGGSDASSKIKSSTKIKIKKKLTEKLDLSVSSTLGGSMDPTQEMNLDLKIDSNISLEGVYEIKSSTETENESTNSAGADLKFNWSFK